MFANRLRKNARHLRTWAGREGLTAYRLYDLDIPKYPFALDWYDGRVHVIEYPRRSSIREGRADTQRAEVLQAIEEVLGVPPERIFTKTHQPKPWGREQYGRQGAGGARFTVQENGLHYWVNLSDYLDTGLFLDHRITRAQVHREASEARFLNLFSYTGSFTVSAATGGAKSTVSVDLSQTYLGWTADNLLRNGVESSSATLVRADALRWMAEAAEREAQFDLIVMDPPSFSSSKRMAGTLDVQRDHPKLLARALALLSSGGTLYFSTNFRGFSLDAGALQGTRFEEITPKSIPPDFRQRDVHRCWRITAASASPEPNTRPPARR